MMLDIGSRSWDLIRRLGRGNELQICRGFEMGVIIVRTLNTASASN